METSQLDDFGAGYSNLNLFARLAPDILKIDSDLIRNIHQRSVAAASVEMLHNLCRNLGITLIAEGIETAEEYHALRNIGIKLMQGYFLARPAFEAFPEFTLPDMN